MSIETFICSGALHGTALGDMLVVPLFRNKLGDPGRTFVQRVVDDYVVSFEEVDLDPDDRILKLNDGRELAVGDRPLFGFVSADDGLVVGNGLQLAEHLSMVLDRIDHRPALKRLVTGFLRETLDTIRTGLEAAGRAPNPLLAPVIEAVERSRDRLVRSTPAVAVARVPLVETAPDELDNIIVGDAVEVMRAMPSASVDMIFADPPIGSAIGALPFDTGSSGAVVGGGSQRPAVSRDHDAFTEAWLSEARRLLRDDGSLWVIGSYHSIYRVGAVLQDLGFWILNDIVWRKVNPMPNFRGTRFTNAHETLIWASKGEHARYTFNYRSMKTLNDELQMRSDWEFPVVGGAERIKRDGAKLLPSQKPEALLYRVLLASTKPGDVVLDPFFGTGTTGAAAKRLGRRWIGIERDEGLRAVAEARIAAAAPIDEVTIAAMNTKPAKPKVAFGTLVEDGRIEPGTVLTDAKRRYRATVLADGSLTSEGHSGSIHRLGALLQNAPACNGWAFWHIEQDGRLIPLDQLRQQLLLERA